MDWGALEAVKATPAVTQERCLGAIGDAVPPTAGALPAQEFKIGLEPLTWQHSRRTPETASIIAFAWLSMVCLNFWKGVCFPWALWLWVIKQCIHCFWVLGLYHLRGLV